MRKGAVMQVENAGDKVPAGAKVVSVSLTLAA